MADFFEQALSQCGFALGSGARMKIKLTALTQLHDHVRLGFKTRLEAAKDPSDHLDPGPGEPRWKRFDNFILDCCETIGRLAASTATARGSRFIEVADLKPAFNQVSLTNSPTTPGDFCPKWL